MGHCGIKLPTETQEANLFDVYFVNIHNLSLSA